MKKKTFIISKSHMKLNFLAIVLSCKFFFHFYICELNKSKEINIGLCLKEFVLLPLSKANRYCLLVLSATTTNMFKLLFLFHVLILNYYTSTKYIRKLSLHYSVYYCCIKFSVKKNIYRD